MAPGGSQTTVGVTVAANMDVSGILNGVKSMQGAFNGLKLPANLTGDAIKQFDKLKESLTKYRELMEKGPSTKADLKQLEKLEKTIKSSFSDLSKVYDELSGKKIYLEADATAIKNAQKDIDQLKQDIQNKLGSIKFEFSSPTKGKIDIGLNELTSDMERAVKSSKVVSASMKEMTNSIRSGNFTEASKGLIQIEQQAVKLKGASVGLLKTFQQMGLIQFNKSAEDLYKSGQHVVLLQQGFEKLRGALSADDAELKQFIKSLEDAVVKKGELEKIGEQHYNNSIAKQVQDTNQLKQGYDQCADAAHNFAQQTLSAAQQVEQLQQSTQYFFSLRNMINLLKRGIDEAVQSVKDLDKAMTETAVVTDYKVSDLWGMLPEYTKVANQLGATTQGAYETMTLYYQQGLEQQQAFELGAETMKMARIAGLDYAETTDMMTAALRGFNMELNETSAKRVNDVYSELAAITASDTEELGTAMQRTASIAASAGASFEGTTAFLAQAIETTREPAENIGTAMKTIVARFQEMKKNPLEISEVDGEEVDYNKIDAALKTIGVDLKDTNGQFRDFDQVMLDISARWDGLSQSQQRYIATVAAGSRQQSRFIAMVSNYERTMQLMEAANNSAGASDEQFGKTMDSLESKLNQLHNAWQQFTMGIANNNMIKMAVDGLTGFLNITNKIIDVLSLGSGALKSFLSVFAAFTGLKAAGRIANKAIGGLGGLVDPTSTFKEGFKGGAIRQGQTGTAQAKAISDPIVTAINRIYGAITGKQVLTNQTAQNTSADFQSFKRANADMRDFLDGIKANDNFSLTEAYGKISGLDIRQQQAVLQQLPGLQLSLQKNGITFDKSDLSSKATQLVKAFNDEINQGLKNKTIDTQAVMQIFGTPQNLMKAAEIRGTEYAQAMQEALYNGFDYDEALTRNILEASRDNFEEVTQAEIIEFAQQAAQEEAEAYAQERLKSFSGKASRGMELANYIAGIGQAATIAGQGVAQLGMQLSNAGFSEAGQAVTNLGYQISSLGQIATSVGAIVGKISNAGGIIGLVKTHPVVAALTAVGVLAGVAITHLKKTKEAGEEVAKTFKETSTSTEDNISKLKAYRNELATLSKGVDKNGNNINLEDSQYERYLEIVDDIAEINPDIVEGYNAQGHAIINNNKALAETLKKQQQLKKETYDTYTSKDSLQKLINARSVNKGYIQAKTISQSGGPYLGYGQTPLAGDVSSIANQLSSTKDFNEGILKKYGIESLDALISGEDQAVKNFVKHRQQIEAELTNSGLELGESVVKGFEKINEKDKAFNEAIQPVYDNLLAQVSNTKAFETIGQEFQPFLQSGLKDIASKDLGAGEMIKEAKTLALRFENLSSESSEYSQALDTVTEAQDNFAATLDETQYETDVAPAIEQLESLKEAALDEGSVYGSALAEYLETQIQQIARFTTEGSVNITEALNTAVDEIAAAEGALENFNSATEKDYWTAAEGMKSIYDKATETFEDSYGTEIQKHFEGKGDRTAWAAADALLDQESIDKIYEKADGDGYKAADMAAKKIQSLEPMLREGQEGFEAFEDRVLASQDALRKLDGVEWDSDGLLTNIPEDKWHAVAEALDISDEMLTSMLNKGRQFADISFTNWDDVRKAFATSESAIEGITASGQKKLFVKESTFEQSLADANISRNEYDSYKKTAKEEQGFDFLKPAEAYKQGSEVLAKKFNEMGVKTLPDLVNTLVKTGDFNREEIKGYAEKMNWLDSETYYDEAYDSAISALENPELAKQTSIQQQISDQLSLLVGKDIESAQQGEQDLQNFINSDEIQNFANGQNAEGKNLSAGEYEATKKNIEEVAQAARKRSEEELRFAELTTGAERLQHQQLAKALSEDADKLDKFGKSGVKAFKDIDTQAKINAKEKEGKAAKDKAKQMEAGTYEPSNVRQLRKEYEETHESKTVETTETTTKNEETNKVEKYDAETTAFYEKQKKDWEKEKKETKLDKEINYDANTNGVKKANKDLDGIEAKTRTPYTVVVGADAKQAEAETQATVQYILSQNPQIPVGANTSSAKSSISGLYNVRTLFVPVKPDFQGDWTKTVVIKKSNGNTRGLSMATQPGAIGKNNNAYFSAPILAHSAARGYGRLGPKGKGGPTLTGELGYEIAWLPSENRSMILGANGPQMVDLPGDAVVWTHEQSKKIMKQKAIPAGSHAREGAKPGSTKRKYDSSDSSDDSSDSNNKKPGKGNGKGKGKSVKLTNKLEIATGKINKWWDNIDRKVDKVTKSANRLGDQVTKRLNDIRASIDQVNKKNEKFVNKQKQVIKYNQAEYDTARAGLSSKQYKKLSLASKSITKKTSKEKAKEIRNARKELGISRKTAKARKKAIDSEKKVEVSWKAPKKVKSGKNKNKLIADKTVDVNRKVNIRKYLKYDSNTGTYTIDTNKINKASKFTYKTKKGKTKTKTNKEKAEALSKAAETYLNDMQNRKDEAQENITKAQDELADYRKQIDDTFFGWKNELTQVLRITSEIERKEAAINKNKAKQERTQMYLDNVDLSLGSEGTDLRTYFTLLGMQIKQNIELNNDENTLKAKQIEANKKEMDSMARLTDAQVKYEDINGKTKTESELHMYERISKIKNNGTGLGWDELSTQEKKIFARQEAFKRGIIVGDSDKGYSLNEGEKGKGGLVDYLAAISNGEIQEELGSLLKEVWDDLNDKTLENLQLQSEIYSTETENLQLYQDYKEQAKQIAEQLYGWKNSLTKVLELTNKIELAEKRISYLKSADELFNRQILSGRSVEDGVSSADIVATYMAQMVDSVTAIQHTNAKLDEQRKDLQSYLTGEDIYKEINNLSSSAPTEANIARLEQLQKDLEIRQRALNYGRITQNDDGTVSVDYFSNLLDKDKGTKFDSETAQAIEQFYQELTTKSGEIRDTMQSSLDKTSDLYQGLIDLRQEYADRAKEIREAYVEQKQREIDAIKTIYTAIDNEFKELISQVKQNIQQRRQIEDNAKTERDISRKQQRLSMLQADTAGGNQVTIAQLRKEITEAQQSYGRTLEDQLMERLSIQGDVAAKQREHQIELMQAQHNIAKETGVYARELNEWFRSGTHKQELTDLLKEKENWNALTEKEQDVLSGQLADKLTTINTAPSKIEATTKAIESLEGVIKGDEKGKGGLASTIGETVGSSISAASKTTVSKFDKLFKELFGDKEEGTTGKFGELTGATNGIVEALQTRIANKLFGKEGDKEDKGILGELNETLNNNFDNKLKEVADKIKDQTIKVEVSIDPATLNPQTEKEDKDDKAEAEKVVTEAEKKTKTEDTKKTADEEEAKKKAAKDKAQKQLTDAWNAYKTVNWGDVNDIRGAHANLRGAIQEAQKQGIDTSNYSVDKAMEIFKPKPAPPSTTSNKGVIGSRGGSGTNGGSGGTAYDPYTEFLIARASKQKSGDSHWGEIGKAGLTTLFKAKGARTEWDALHDLANFGGQGAPLYGEWEKILKAYIDYKGGEKAAYKAIHSAYKKGATASNKREEKWNKVFKTKAYKFKTGGIADFTGPAWLDGTPSKPELVLNATDTRNFLALRDVLSKALSSTNSVTNSYGGDAMYEININVDHLSSDYDVDKVVEKVKKEITKGAGYRNVTQVRNFR